MSDFTIILPHKRNPGNDAALRISLDCLFANTRNDFHLVMDAVFNKPLYDRIHHLVLQATTNCVVYWSSDIFCAPDWDIPMLEAFAAAPERRIVFGACVEPGVLGVAAGNIGMNFGKRPETFNRHAFEQFALTDTQPLPGGFSFPVPMMFPRDLYLRYDYPLLDQADFYPRDDVIIDRMVADGVCERVRARSYVYHLQRYSDETMQQRGDRD